MSDDGAENAGKRERYHHGDLRRHLLKVAGDEIARHGAEAVSLASLSRLAEVAQSAPFRHFADRRALLEAVAAEGFATLTRKLRAALSEPGDTPVTALAHAYLSFGEDNGELYRLMFASRLTPDAPDGSALGDAAEAAFDLLRQTLAVQADSSSGPSREDAVYRMWAQLHGLVMLKADGFITSALARYLR